MNYYVMTDKKERGCPKGLLRADLYDKFYSNIKKVEHGYFPWYRESRRSGTRTPFPEGMVLIAKERLLDFDIRDVSYRFYIASDEFLSLSERFGLKVLDKSRVEVVSQSGKKISSKRYSAVVFDELEVLPNVGEGSVFDVEGGVLLEFKKLVLPVDLNRGIFKYKGLVGLSDSFICSQEFKDAAVDLKGVAYTPLDEMDWRMPMFDDFLY